MNSKSILMVALWMAGVGAASTTLGCHEEAPPANQVSAADKAASDKAAAEKLAAEKAKSEKAIADKSAKDKASAKAEAAALPPDMVETQAEITRMTSQIDVTMAKLDKLASETGDIEKPTEEALEAIKALDAETKVLQKRGDQMRDRGAAYFEDWDKQLAAMSTPEVAALATKRKDELAAKYAEVLTSMQTTRVSLDSYWDDMKSIEKDLDKGLSSDAHKLLAGRVKAAKDKATTLKSRIQETFAKLNDVSLIYAKR